MHVRPSTHRRRVGRYGAAALVAFSLVAAACGDKKDDDEVATDDTEAAEDTTPEDTATDDTAQVTTPESDTTEAPAPVVTEPPESEFDPVIGGKLVVAGEAEAANPWTPANVQCDSYCQMRVHAFYDPLFTVNDQLEVTPYLAESITANEDSTAFTIKVREGITFHDGTPLDADAVMDNLNRSFRSLLIGAAVKDIARNLADPGADPNNPQVLFEKIDDFTFTFFTGFNGDPEQPIPWPTFPIYLNGQAGLMASPTWLAAVDAGTAQPTDAVGTGPFVFQSYAPGDRLIVTKNPDYWRSDENGNQLPYLDEIEFRVIVDSQVRAQALESGDVDMIADVGQQRHRRLRRQPGLPDGAAEPVRRDELLAAPPDNPAARQPRCAMRAAAGHRQGRLHRRGQLGLRRTGQRPVLARPGGLPRRQRRAGVRPRSRIRGDRGVRGGQRPDHHQLLDHADCIEPHPGAVHRRCVGRDRGRHLDQPDRAVDADQQRLVRRPVVRRLRLA